MINPTVHNTEEILQSNKNISAIAPPTTQTTPKKNKIKLGVIILGVGCFGLIILTCCAVASIPLFIPDLIDSSTDSRQTTDIDITESPESKELTHAELKEEIKLITDQTSELRGLDYNFEDLQFEFITEDELSQKILEIVGEKPEDEYFDESLFKALEVIPEDINIYDTYISFYEEQILGFYYPEEEKFYILSGTQELNVSDKTTIAHEFTHYLQDKYYDIEQMDKKYDLSIESNEDIYQAYTALLEGDATYTMYLYLHTLSNKEQKEYWSISYDEPDLPKFLVDSFSFPYVNGYYFVEDLYKQTNDFSLVDKVYTDMVKSTEQILHPEKYKVDEVGPYTLSEEVISWFQTEYVTTEELYFTHYTLGELDTKLVLQEFMNIDRATEAAMGWNGNSTTFWYDPETGKYLVVMYYLWDTQEDLDDYILSANYMCTKLENASDCYTAEPITDRGYLESITTIQGQRTDLTSIG